MLSLNEVHERIGDLSRMEPKSGDFRIADYSGIECDMRVIFADLLEILHSGRATPAFLD